jgi:NTE family protein
MLVKTNLRLILVLFLIQTGCATFEKNPTLNAYNKETGYRYQVVDKSSQENSEEVFVVLAFSGGGTRAAAFSYGLMRGLKDAKYNNGTRTFLDEVDVISSVSGGSFTAAYYGLFPDRLFTSFQKEFLEQNVQGDLVKRVINPLNWFRLASSSFDRIDLAAEYYNEKFFKGKTYQDLIGNPRKPYIIINATDMSLGRRFEFTQDQFDLLCSDLSGVKVGRAVAASSAFPGLLSPLTIKNYSDTDCGYKTPKWISNALIREDNPKRRYFNALDLMSYRDPLRKYVHLLDGGLSDNIGLRGPYHALTTTDSPWSIVQKINQRKVKELIVITANAKTKSSNDWDQKQTAPSLLDVFGFVATGPMDNFSFDSVEQVTNHFKQMRQLSKSLSKCNEKLDQCSLPKIRANLPKVNYHEVEISFDRIKNAHLRKCMEGLPTSFSLSSGTVELLIQVAHSLLMNNNSFRSTMKALDKEWRPLDKGIDPEIITKVCGPIPPEEIIDTVLPAG